MSRKHGIDPYEFVNPDDENVDMKFIAGMAAMAELSLEKDVLDDFVDGLYQLGLSPESVDMTLHTRELNEGNWN